MKSALKIYNYQNPESAQTLREGLDEYYDANPEFSRTGEFLAQSRETVLGHDTVHVVFGLGATSEEELIVEVATVFACILPLQKIKKAKKIKFFSELWKMFGPWRLAKRFVLTTPRMLRAFFTILQMTKRWPHFGYEQYLDVPLKTIRAEFGIKLPV